MTLKCPHCGSDDVRHRNLARKIGGAVGSIAGAASGASGILGAARIGFVVGAPIGPYGALMSAIAAATLRSIVGATIGCEIGTALGELIDAHILENDACRKCGHTFKESTGGSSVLSSIQSWRFPGRSHGPDRDDDEDGDGYHDEDDDNDPVMLPGFGQGHHRGPFPALT